MSHGFFVSSRSTFQMFQTKMQFIDKHTFPDSSSDQYAGYAVANIKDEILEFLEKALKEKQPKDNCRI